MMPHLHKVVTAFGADVIWNADYEWSNGCFTFQLFDQFKEFMCPKNDYFQSHPPVSIDDRFRFSWSNTVFPMGILLGKQLPGQRKTGILIFFQSFHNIRTHPISLFGIG